MASTLDSLAEAAAEKAGALRDRPAAYLVFSALAGIYVGFGVVLSVAVAAPLVSAGSPLARLLLGGSFGIALSLVTVAGAELFTGNILVMVTGRLIGRSGWGSLVAVWLFSFAGNLAGGVALAWLLLRSGVFASGPTRDFMEQSAATKMQLSFGALLARGLICNWLVCLAVWCSSRLQSETARLLMIWWCLFAFVAAGFEHSVANMTLLNLALLQPHGDTVTLAGFVHNLVPVTLGNIAGGALFVGAAYWFIQRPVTPRSDAHVPQVAARPAASPHPAAGRFGGLSRTTRACAGTIRWLSLRLDRRSAVHVER